VITTAPRNIAALVIDSAFAYGNRARRRCGKGALFD